MPDHTLSRSSSTVLASLLLASVPACDGGSAMHYEIYRAAAGEELEFAGGGCITRESGGGVGGGTHEYVMRQSNAARGGMTITWLVPLGPREPEDLPDSDDEELVPVGVVTMDRDQLEAGESAMVEFDTADSVRFEIVHWGSGDGC